jgi:hypothetical protein
MAGLDPAIHALFPGATQESVDHRVKPGDDDSEC